MVFKRWIQAFADWLERKFPDQVIVTLENYKRLQKEIETMRFLQAHLQGMVEGIAAQIKELSENKGAEERLKKMESEINKFNVSLGFAGDMISRKMGAFQR